MNSSLLQVRIITIKPRKEKASYLCHLRCQEKLNVTRAKCKIHPDHFHFHYGTADIMCPLPSGCSTPSHVAVTSVDGRSEGIDCKLNALCRNQVTFLLHLFVIW